MTRPGRTGLPGLALLVAVTVNQLRWARRTRPGRPPAPADGAVIVTTTDGMRLAGQVGGATDSDTTVVFVHGLLARSIEFDMQWNALADRARLVRYDHRNHGRSDRAHDSSPCRPLRATWRR